MTSSSQCDASGNNCSCQYGSSFCQVELGPEEKTFPTFACGEGGTGGGGSSTSEDFSIIVTPRSATIDQGFSYTFIVSVKSENGFSGAVDLKATCPLGASCIFASPVVKVSEDASVSTGYTITTSAATVASKLYTIDYTGTAGSITHAVDSSLYVGTGFNDATCGNADFPGNVSAGGSFTAEIAMNNSGTRIWQSGSTGNATPHRLGLFGAAESRADMLEARVGQGKGAHFNARFSVPINPAASSFCEHIGSGAYSCDFTWKMVQEGVQWFGPTCSKKVTVQASIKPVVDLKINNSDGPLSVISGQNLQITWQATNAATCVADNDFSLGNQVWKGVKNAGGGSENTSIATPATVTFSLKCSNASGEAIDKVVVAVNNSGSCSLGASRACGNAICPGSQNCGSDGEWSVCNFAGSNGIACNDGNACTGLDVCGGGMCAGVGQNTCTNTCTNYGFKSVNSGISQRVVVPLQPVTVWCDYGSVIDSAQVTGISCEFLKFNGTQAEFTCTAPASQGLYPVSCMTQQNVGSSNSCSQQNSLGNIQVTQASSGGARPAITVDPNALYFGAQAGGSAPASQNVRITNSGAVGSTLSFSAKTDKDWCRVNGINSLSKDSSGNSVLWPMGGPLARLESQLITVSMDRPSSEGVFTCTVTVSDQNAVNNPQTISVTYTVGGVPTGTGSCNGNNCPSGGGGNPVCSELMVYWKLPQSATPTGYRIYRSSKNPSSSGFQESDWQRAAQVGADVLFYKDTHPLRPGADNYYSVSAVYGNSESAKALMPPITPLVCQANMSASDKDITAVNNLNFPVSSCGGSDAPPAETAFKNGDAVTFTINLCNISPSSQQDARNVVVRDTFLNIERYNSNFPATDGRAWNAKLDGKPISPISVSGVSPNQTLVFAIPGGIPKQTLKKLVLQGRVTVPTDYTANFARFSNQADIQYLKDLEDTQGIKTVLTPLIRFSNGTKVPEKQEVAP